MSHATRAAEQEEEEIKELKKNAQLAHSKFLSDYQSVLFEGNKRSEALVHSMASVVITLQRAVNSFTRTYHDIALLDNKKKREIEALKDTVKQSMQNWFASEEKVNQHVQYIGRHHIRSPRAYESSTDEEEGFTFTYVQVPGEKVVQSSVETPHVLQEEEEEKEPTLVSMAEESVGPTNDQLLFASSSYSSSSSSSESSSDGEDEMESSDVFSSSSSEEEEEGERNGKKRKRIMRKKRKDDPWHVRWTDRYDIADETASFGAFSSTEDGDDQSPAESSPDGHGKKRKLTSKRDVCLLRATPHASGPYNEWLAMHDNEFLGMFQGAYTRYVSSNKISGVRFKYAKDDEDEDMIDYGGWRSYDRFDGIIGFIDQYCLYCQYRLEECGCTCVKGHLRRTCRPELHRNQPYLGFITTAKLYSAVADLMRDPFPGVSVHKVDKEVLKSTKETQWNTIHDLLRTFLSSDRMCKILIDLMLFNVFAKAHWRSENAWKKPRCAICRFRTINGNTAHTLCHACRSTGSLKNRWKEYRIIAEPLKVRVTRLKQKLRGMRRKH